MFALKPIMIASITIKELSVRIDAIMTALRTIEEVSVRIDANHDSF